MRPAEVGSRDEHQFAGHSTDAPRIGKMDRRQWQSRGRRGQSLMRTLQPDHIEALFWGSKIMNLLVFFDFEPKKCFRVPTSWGLYGAVWDGPPVGPHW